jgi:hypothetical protein
MILLRDFVMLTEGYFHLPVESYREVYDYVTAAYKKYHLRGGKVTVDQYPEKEFVLNLSGTRFKFLGDVRFKLNFSGSDSYYYSNVNTVTIALKHTLRYVYDTLEHELLHVIQYAIMRYKKTLGGLPGKKFLPNDISVLGYKDNDPNRRVNHQFRPVEYYPNLLSAIREIQHNYVQSLSLISNDSQLHNNSIINNVDNKKTYFKHVLSLISRKENHGFFFTAHSFLNAKKVSTEFFNHMVKIAYDAFVNRPINIHLMKSMDRVNISVSDGTGEEIIFRAIAPLKIPNTSSGELLGDKFNGDKNTVVNDIFDKIGLKAIDGAYYLPRNVKNIKFLFDGLMKLKKERFQTEVLLYTGEFEFGNNYYRLIYDMLFDNLYKKYMSAVDSTTKNDLEILIKTTYTKCK